MAITNAQVTLDEAATIDKRLHCVSRVDGGTGNTVLSETFVLIDPDDATVQSMARVLNTSPAGTEYALITRNIPSGTQQVSDGGGSISVDDNAGSLTVDSAQLPAALVGGRLDVNIGASGVTINVADGGGAISIDDNGGLISVDDGGGSLTVDGSVSITGNVAVDVRRGQTLQFASISVASSGDNSIVAAAGAGNKIKVVSYVLVADGTVNVTWRSATNAKTGAMALVANSGIAICGSPGSWLLETNANEALNLNLSAAIGVRGHVSYFVET